MCCVSPLEQRLPYVLSDNLGAKPYFGHPRSHIPVTGGMGVVLNMMQPLAEEEKF